MLRELDVQSSVFRVYLEFLEDRMWDVGSRVKEGVFRVYGR